MQERERRQTLADFLRKRRESLSPAEVGLPPGLRRRTPGLRREEVAQLANIGTSWYVWLEQGRDVHPSAQVLESLAQALKLTANERRHLFLLAGQPFPSLASPTEESVSMGLRQMLADLDPAPAYVMGRRYDFLAWNRAADALLSLSETASSYDRNLIWRLFTSPRMRKLPGWEQIARGTLAEFRAANARYPGDAWFEELIEDLTRVSSEFEEWWPHHDARSTLDCHKVIQHATLGRLEFEQLNLQVVTDPDLKIVVYSPYPQTRAVLEQALRAVPAQSSQDSFLS